jgi:hypothetical protein
MDIQCPLLKAIDLNNKYDDAIWFVKRRKIMDDNKEFWQEVYDELIKL